MQYGIFKSAHEEDITFKGLKRNAAAKKLGVSIRTFYRRISDLKEELESDKWFEPYK